MLSSGKPSLRAVTCMIAVLNAVGLNRPDSHKHTGVSISFVHATICWYRRIISENQGSRCFLLHHAYFSQLALDSGFLPGTWSMDSALARSSIGSVMFSSPFWPFCSVSRDVRISVIKVFMFVASCSATSTCGASSVFSFGEARSWTSTMLNSCGSCSMSISSVRTNFDTPAAPLAPFAFAAFPPPLALDSPAFDFASPFCPVSADAAPLDALLPSSARIALQSSWARPVRYPISAFGCIPKRMGFSSGSASSINAV
mmetsp:Transcript_162501/g.394831  ORF Transcript_162501/g.394831 Transcript_162501/m.394831 type:complete len:257 (+) Transcript_162501:564-1334(+)